MHIISKKRRGSGEPLHVIEFQSQKELSWTRELREAVKTFYNDTQDESIAKSREALLSMLDKIESRTDDSYANDTTAFSSMLFNSEMDCFVAELWALSCVGYWKYLGLNEAYDRFLQKVFGVAEEDAQED